MIITCDPSLGRLPLKLVIAGPLILFVITILCLLPEFIFNPPPKTVFPVTFIAGSFEEFTFKIPLILVLLLIVTTELLLEFTVNAPVIVVFPAIFVALFNSTKSPVNVIILSVPHKPNTTLPKL